MPPVIDIVVATCARGRKGSFYVCLVFQAAAGSAMLANNGSSSQDEHVEVPKVQHIRGWRKVTKETDKYILA